jgi:hypothetical protein
MVIVPANWRPEPQYSYSSVLRFIRSGRCLLLSYGGTSQRKWGVIRTLLKAVSGHLGITASCNLVSGVTAGSASVATWWQETRTIEECRSLILDNLQRTECITVDNYSLLAVI